MREGCYFKPFGFISSNKPNLVCLIYKTFINLNAGLCMESSSIDNAIRLF